MIGNRNPYKLTRKIWLCEELLRRIVETSKVLIDRFRAATAIQSALVILSNYVAVEASNPITRVRLHADISSSVMLVYGWLHFDILGLLPFA